MNKKELKDAFEKEFEKISVSDELKAKTINSINTKPVKKASHIPYLRNFAAVFTVTLLCISIYFTNNYTKKQAESFDALENESVSDTGITKNSLQQKNSFLKSNSTFPQDEEVKHSYGLYDDFSVEKASPSSLRFNSAESVLYDTTEKESGDFEPVIPKTENEFLALYPNAEKLENGYALYENGKEILYIFQNGNLENIIIID